MDRLSALEMYIRVIDTGSFSAAARNLNTGQSSVSKAIAQLEQWLGVRLLLRSTRSLTPTEAGLVFYEYAKRTVDNANEAVRLARGVDAGLSGHLRVSAPICFSRLHIVPQLSRFLAGHPDLDIELILNEGSIDLVNEGVDVALCMGAEPEASMVIRKIGQGRRLVMATPAYWAQHGTPTSPEDLINYPSIIYSQDDTEEARMFHKGSEQVKAQLGGRVTISASEGLRTAVLAGVGLTIAGEWSFANELIAGDVVTVLNDWHLAPLPLYAVFPAGQLVSAKARAFVNFVESCQIQSKAYTA